MRLATAWTGAFALFAVLAGGGIVAADATVLSATSFAQEYLRAVQSGDVGTALAIAGQPDAASAASQRFEVDQVTDRGSGAIEVHWHGVDGVPQRTLLHVEPTGAFGGVLAQWRFSEPPTATLEVAVAGDTRFRVNGLGMTATAVQGDVAGAMVPVLIPGVYTADHESSYLSSAPATVAVPGAIVEADVRVIPRQSLVDAVQQSVDAQLASCATQQVMFPTGCAMGLTVRNRVVSTPQWTMVQNPVVQLQPGTAPGEWEVVPADARAHLVVKVQSLFDGSVTTIDQDVPFRPGYTVTVAPDDSVTMVPVVD